jgi:transcriptional activator HAC1
MEATHNSLQIIQNYVKTPSINVDPPKTIKMEDVHAGASSPSATSSSLLDIPAADSTPKGSESRQVKKRKSWGQVLPEPKTNLPPRKVFFLTPDMISSLLHTDCLLSAPRQPTRRSSGG